MKTDELNELVHNILNVQDKIELRDLVLGIEGKFINDELTDKQAIAVQMATSIKSNEFAILTILELLNEIATASAEGIEVPNIDKLH